MFSLLYYWMAPVGQEIWENLLHPPHNPGSAYVHGRSADKLKILMEY